MMSLCFYLWFQNISLLIVMWRWADRECALRCLNYLLSQTVFNQMYFYVDSYKIVCAKTESKFCTWSGVFVSWETALGKMISWALGFSVVLKRFGQVFRQWNRGSAEEKSDAHWLWMLYLGNTVSSQGKLNQNSPEAGKKNSSEKFRLHSGLAERVEVGSNCDVLPQEKKSKGLFLWVKYLKKASSALG